MSDRDDGSREVGVPELIPARMLNEFVYCPRLSYMEWVQGEFAHSEDTLDGRFQHRRVDQPSGDLREPESDEDAEHEKIHARSVLLSDETLGAIARIDLVEAQGPTATPIDYKRGTVPDVPGNAYNPERVLVALTLEMLDAARAMAVGGKIPPPLEGSPKCPRCSLVGICLPDEVTFLKGSRHVVKPDDVRRMAPERDDALPMYVTTQGGVVGKSGDNLTVSVKREVVARARLLDVSSLPYLGMPRSPRRPHASSWTERYPSATSPTEAG